MPPVLSGGGEKMPSSPKFKNPYLRIETSDGGRSGCVGKVLTQKTFFKRLGCFSSACTQQARAWKNVAKNGHFVATVDRSVPSRCKSCLGSKFVWNPSKWKFSPPHLPHLLGTPLIRVLQLFENGAQKIYFGKFPYQFWLEKFFSKIFQIFLSQKIH